MSRLSTTCPACGCGARNRVIREFDYRRPDVEGVREWWHAFAVGDSTQITPVKRSDSWLWKKFSQTPWVTTGWEEVECTKCKSTYRNVWTFESQEITLNQVEEDALQEEYKRAAQMSAEMYRLLKELEPIMGSKELGPSPKMVQEVEDLLKAIKNGGEG
jgi:hypothetical protein